MSCAMSGCSNNRRFKPEGISFHTFPRDELLQRWLEVLNLDPKTWVWSKNKVVCSKHFNEDDFIIRGGKKTLKLHAVPKMVVKSVDEAKDYEEKPSKSREVLQSSSSSSQTISESTISQPSLLEVEDPSTSIKRPLKRKLSKTKVKCQESSTSTDSSEKRRKVAFIKSIHNYSISPRKIKAKNINLRKKHLQVRRKLYRAKQKISTLQKEVTNLKVVIDELKRANLLSDHALDHLEKSYQSVPHLLMKRYLKNIHNETVTHENYPPTLREFASVLQFYSNKAYEYVRQQFSLALPHQATIRKWCSNIDCSPGFIEPAFDALKIKVTENAANNRELLCAMMLDEIAIKKQIDFDGKRMWGYVDIGMPCANDEQQPATEALVIMVVSHQSHWKIAVAYFLIKSLSGREKANIINNCLLRLKDIRVTITSVTCDGPSANFTMLTELGCNFDDVHDLKTWFQHPSDVQQKIFCILDACHMLKLMRNLLASLEQIKDPDGNIVSWNYIKALYDLQEQEMFNIVNKLKKSHLEWHKQKMKVNLAAQVLSKSVADALDFLNEELHIPQFKGSEATVNFIRRIDKLFDLLNSRSPQAKGYKAPLRVQTEEDWRSFALETVNYLLYCTDVQGTPLWNTPRKTPVLGFAISTLSACGIFDSYVKSGKLNYLLTYKCSQDHLEIFFCTVRSRNGWNNNPTALQFTRTFRKLLLHSQISGKGGNCRVLDTTTMLTIPSSSSSKCPQYFDITAYQLNSEDPSMNVLHDHDYDLVPDVLDINIVAANVVTYIAGFVIKMLSRTVKCATCMEACGIALEDVQDDPKYKLLYRKDKGGLHIPSQGLSTICIKVENEIRKIISFTNYKLPQDPDFFNHFILIMAQQFYGKVLDLFPLLEHHLVEIPIYEENHGFILIKAIIGAYSRIRFFNLAKGYTTVLQGTQVRRQLHKLILFNHQ